MDIGELIDAGPVGGLQRTIIFTCFLISLLDGFDQSLAAVVGPALIRANVVDVSAFAWLVSASVLGFVAGTLVFGAAADRFGRRRVLMTTVAIFAAGSLLCAYCRNAPELVGARLVTGIGLGGSSPCFVSLAAEFAPRRLRSTVVTTVWAGIPLGGVLGGLVGGLASHGNWSWMFLLGALLPLPLIAWLWAYIPESLSFLVLKTGRTEDVRAVLMRIRPQLAVPRDADFAVAREPFAKATPATLFAGGRAIMTVSLWSAFLLFSGQLNMVSQYTPILLRDGGGDANVGPLVLSAFYAGGVIGAFIAGPALRWLPKAKAVIALMVIAAISSAPFGWVFGAQTAGLIVAAAWVGLTQSAAITAIVGLTSELYPLALRGTAFGWALGVSRLGSMAGPLLSARLIVGGLDHRSYYLVTSGLALCAASAAAAGMGRMCRKTHVPKSPMNGPST